MFAEKRFRVAIIDCATMARQSSHWMPLTLFIATILLLMALPPVVDAGPYGPGMKISFYNKMPPGIQHAVKAHCFRQSGAPGGYSGDCGYWWFKPGTWWEVWIASNNDHYHDYGGTRYWCEFRTLNKPLTWVNLFVGTGGARNQPCECVDEACQWMISNEGLSCGSYPNRYLHKWGQPLN
ncbi:hypothetical protein M758_10G135300 [Ceratodon purpureus]|uniref:Uncharacterized protein n=1 Tax=Ceratodon purpureus TaxID=3225 RepID=A0A8T0GP06_CERPU|nr:hypothetical protein KC19_10G139700 [Ceratodon purpureus]KAG0603982.1 hypothetical protein M758_10G135300 [Ceratodon purpureus]